MLISEFLNDSN